MWRIIFVVFQKGKIETVWRAGAKEASLTFLIYINLWSLRVCSLPGGGGAKYHLKNFCFYVLPSKHPRILLLDFDYLSLFIPKRIPVEEKQDKNSLNATFLTAPFLPWAAPAVSHL